MIGAVACCLDAHMPVPYELEYMVTADACLSFVFFYTSHAEFVSHNCKK
jgi:hypothetical protein